MTGRRIGNFLSRDWILQCRLSARTAACSGPDRQRGEYSDTLQAPLETVGLVVTLLEYGVVLCFGDFFCYVCCPSDRRIFEDFGSRRCMAVRRYT